MKKSLLLFVLVALIFLVVSLFAGPNLYEECAKIGGLYVGAGQCLF